MKYAIERLRKREEGFTLVELIVVLVILALLAAILVPTLLGYIDKARTEKDYATAQTVRVAAQATVDEAYAAGSTLEAITDETDTYGDEVYTLSGVGDDDVTAFNFTVTDGAIESGTVTIDDSVYTLADGSWSAAKEE